MNAKKIVVASLIILALGAGGYFGWENYLKQKDIKPNDGFLSEGQEVSSDTIQNLLNKRVQKGSAIYEFTTIKKHDDKTDTIKGKVYWIDFSNYKLEKGSQSVVVTKGIVYRCDSNKKCLAAGLSNSEDGIYEILFNYDFLPDEYLRGIKSSDDILSNTRFLGEEIVDNQNTKIFKYSLNTNIFNEQRNVKFWVSDDGIVVKAEVETRRMAYDQQSVDTASDTAVTVRNTGDIENGYTTIDKINFEKINSEIFKMPNDDNTFKLFKAKKIDFSDSDNDGLLDVVEKEITKTDPDNSDTDDDGFKDGDEVENGHSPLIPGEKGKIYND